MPRHLAAGQIGDPLREGDVPLKVGLIEHGVISRLAVQRNQFDQSAFQKSLGLL
jgi:hypothetical protein